MARRRIDPADGTLAVAAWRRDDEPPRSTIATAVRFTLEELAERAPGNSVEVRVPPLGVTQCIEGPRHTRGTPPNVVEADPEAWLEVAVGETDFAAALAAGRMSASGTRADLTAVTPLFDAAELFPS